MKDLERKNTYIGDQGNNNTGRTNRTSHMEISRTGTDHNNYYCNVQRKKVKLL